MSVSDGLYLSTSPDLLRRLLEPLPPPRARLMIGYSGWGPGQLEAELEEFSWIVVDALTDDAFADDPDELWRTVLHRKGGPFELMVDMPFDPGLN